MKKKTISLSIAIFMATLLLSSCSMGKGDIRDRNLEQAALTRLDSIPNVEYVGMSDVRTLDDNRLQTVIIYYVADSVGNKTEHNARITANEDCSEIYSWEDLDTKVLEDTKQKVTDKLVEKGINIDYSLIDKLIELKKR